MKKILTALVIMIFVAMTGGAQAAFLNSPVPSNAYITLNGYNWAWASPCADGNCGSGFGLDLSYQSQFGWHSPDARELALAPLAANFVFSGANVPMGGSDPISGASVGAGSAPGDMAIAVPYFNTLYQHADYVDAPGAGGNELAWNSGGYAEFLVVRSASSVPVPAAVWLLGSGLVGLLGFRRKFSK